MTSAGPSFALLDDRIVAAENAVVSPFDRGFLFGDGVYEMVRTFDRKPVAMDAHVARLARSLDQVGIRGFDAERYRAIVPRLLDAEGIADAGIYLQVTRGVERPRRHVPGDDLVPTVFGFASPLPAIDTLDAVESTEVILVPDDRWGRTDLKSLNLLANVMAAGRGREAGADEVILHREGLVSEGSHSSVVAVIDGVLASPSPLAAPNVLPGTMSTLVLEAADRIGLPVSQAPLPVDRIRRASEIGIASSRRLLHEVSGLDGRKLAGGPWIPRLFASMVDSIADSLGLQTPIPRS
ncbi:MAG: D-amino acid aminotransferase [Phycisphaera sp.]|nr:D-amino acid aminotransferase [Phycisphaera sp.]